MPSESALGAFFNVILEALFPVHPAEREVLSMGQAAAWKSLPRAGHPHIGEACSIFSYKDERVSRLIWSIKYKKSRAGAAIAGYALCRMARFFAGAVPKNMRVMIVPMPMTRARRRERGFNQCELLLDEMEKLDAGRYLTFARDLIIRTRHTSRQTMKNRKERSESIKDMFAVNEKAASLPEMRRDPLRYFIVVIDDVVTTGSTMRDAIATLRRAGFKNTYGLSVAH
jgi:ComF family protein